MLRFLKKLIFILICIKVAENRVIVKFTGLKCTKLDENFCEFKVCEIKPIQRDVSEITVHVVLHQIPVNNITMYFGIHKRGFDRQKSMFQSTIDACAFLRNKKRNVLADVMYKLAELGKYSNINHTCPYDHDILLNHFRFDQNHVNLLPILQGHYTAFVLFSTNGVQRISVDLNIQYMER